MKPKEHNQFDVGQTVYVSKYALSKGIFAVVVGPRSDADVVCPHDDAWVMYWRKRGEVWGTLDAAQQKAREMAERALKSLAKKRAKLESIARMGAKVNT